MAKKRNKDVQPVEGAFSDRPRVRKVVPEPVINPVDEPIEEEITVEEEPVPESNSSTGAVMKYDEYKAPRGAKENGIILTIILSVLILLSLGFLIYYEHSWRLQEQQEEALVDSSFESLTNVVKNYVSTIEETNKEALCKQLYEVYINASESTDDIDSIVLTIREKSQEILGFNDVVAKTKEHEWYKLFGVHGVIDMWLTDSGVVIDKKNQREVFTAIAKGIISGT